MLRKSKDWSWKDNHTWGATTNLQVPYQGNPCWGTVMVTVEIIVTEKRYD